MDFKVIKHNENVTVVQWYAGLIDRLMFRRKNHVAWYVKEKDGYKLWTTNKKVRNVIVPDSEFFEKIKT